MSMNSTVTGIFTAAKPPPKVKLHCKDKSLTRQSEAGATDINRIMKKYEKTGVLPAIERTGFFLDVSEMPDFRTTLHHVEAAREYFMALPAEVRLAFDNDTATFLDALDDPANRAQLVELGILEDAQAAADAEAAADSGGGAPLVPDGDSGVPE